MSILRQADASSRPRSPDDPHYVAVRGVGLDLVGPLQKAAGGYIHLLVAIDKFSKWIEARPITNIRSEQAVLFFTDIIHRFGIPNVIITDNGTQFTGKKFLDFCDRHHIRVNWSAVAHPRTNG